MGEDCALWQPCWEEDMKYILLVYRDRRQCESISSSERSALEVASLANDEILQESGQLFGVERLQCSCTAATVSVQHGRVSVAEGSAMDAEEQLVGIYTIVARDLNEAIQVAATMPQAREGPIEVRPVL
jgi:hypothetical protein